MTSKFEQERFELLMDQIERYAEDQSLVLRRELARVELRLITAQQKRDSAMGPDVRSSAEKQLIKLEAEIDRLEKRIHELDSREDEDYRRCRDRAHERRYIAPTTRRILDVEFVIE